MTQVATLPSSATEDVLSEKPEIWIEDDSESSNPVVESAEFAYEVRLPAILKTDLSLTVAENKTRSYKRRGRPNGCKARKWLRLSSSREAFDAYYSLRSMIKYASNRTARAPGARTPCTSAPWNPTPPLNP